jgi:hypothetical protein
VTDGESFASLALSEQATDGMSRNGVCRHGCVILCGLRRSTR